MRSGPSHLGPFDPGFADLPAELPIFPLTNALLLPGGRLALNIFEKRYLAMVRAALQSPQRLIGMVQPIEANADRNMQADFVPAVHRIGCAGRIVSFEETPDGRYQLILSGLIRFRIKEELPLAKGGYRRVVPNFQPFPHDMAEHEFQLADHQKCTHNIGRRIATARCRPPIARQMPP